MTCAHHCRHQRCPMPHECGYPLRQDNGGQVVDTEADSHALADLGTQTAMPITIADGWLWIALAVILLGVLALIGIGRSKGWL